MEAVDYLMVTHQETKKTLNEVGTNKNKNNNNNNKSEYQGLRP
jgi:hypothetical protein